MFRYALPSFVLGAFMACAIFAAQQPQPIRADVAAAGGHAVVHILSANEDGEAVGETVTPTLIAFRVEEGHVDGAGVLQCEQIQETRTVPPRESHGDQELSRVNEVNYPVVTLHCGSIKLAVVGLDLTVKK